VVGDHPVDFLGGVGAGKVQDGRSGLKTSPGGGGLVSFHGEKEPLRSEFPEDGQQVAGLGLGIRTGSMSEGGFGPKVHQMGAFGPKPADPLHGRGGGGDNAFAVPGIGTEVDHAHEVGPVGRGESRALQREFPDA